MAADDDRHGPERIAALDLPSPQPPPAIADDMARARERLGFVPNVLRAWSHRPERLAAFIAMRDALMAGDDELDAVEREMIAVVVSALNRCHYCLTSHGAALRMKSGDPVLADELTMNWRALALPPRQRAMLEFASRLTEAPDRVGEEDWQRLRAAGFSEQAIWDIAEITAFFNMSNRVAAGTGLVPNREYHALGRQPPVSP